MFLSEPFPPHPLTLPFPGDSIVVSSATDHDKGISSLFLFPYIQSSLVLRQHFFFFFSVNILVLTTAVDHL